MGETTRPPVPPAPPRRRARPGVSAGDTSDLPGDASALRDQFNQQLLQVLTTQQNLTQSQAQCAIDELEQSVTDEELQQAIVEAAQSGQAPQDLINEAFDAGAACADE